MVTGLVIVQIAWIAVILLPVLIILGELISGTDGGDSSVAAEAQKKAGLVIVRVAWIAAFLVAVLVILGELFSGTDGGDSSQQLPEVASTPPAAPVAGVEAQKTAAPQDDRSQRAKEQAPGDSHSSSGVPRRSAAQPGDAGARTPVVTPGPTPPEAPRPKPPRAPRPKPPRAPPEIPAPSQPPVSESPSAPVQTTITVANNNDGP